MFSIINLTVAFLIFIVFKCCEPRTRVLLFDTLAESESELTVPCTVVINNNTHQKVFEETSDTYTIVHVLYHSPTTVFKRTSVRNRLQRKRGFFF